MGELHFVFVVVAAAAAAAAAAVVDVVVGDEDSSESNIEEFTNLSTIIFYIYRQKATYFKDTYVALFHDFVSIFLYVGTVSSSNLNHRGL